MTSMIEKMARAIDPDIWKHFDDYIKIKDYNEQDQTELKQNPGRLSDSLRAARDALEALTEPTDGMISAGGFCDGAENTFKAMIQAALKGR